MVAWITQSRQMDLSGLIQVRRSNQLHYALTKDFAKRYFSFLPMPSDSQNAAETEQRSRSCVGAAIHGQIGARDVSCFRTSEKRNQSRNLIDMAVAFQGCHRQLRFCPIARCGIQVRVVLSRTHGTRTGGSSHCVFRHKRRREDVYASLLREVHLGLCRSDHPAVPDRPTDLAGRGRRQSKLRAPSGGTGIQPGARIDCTVRHAGLHSSRLRVRAS
jgi:hypothetical protein